MNLETYQKLAAKTAVYPKEPLLNYPIIGLAGEVGELCNKYKKTIRDKKPLNKEELILELGDCLWYINAIASDLGVSLDEVARANIEKLHSRMARGKLGGNGDNR